MPCTLPSCLFGAYEVCSVSCVFSFCFSSFASSSDFKERGFVFLREVISGAGAVRGDVVTPLRAHSFRGFATSTVFMQNWSVSKVLEAASWRLNSIFAFFYLRDGRLAIPWPHCGCRFRPSFFFFFFFGLLFCSCERFRGNPVFGEPSLILCLLCFGWWGSGEFSYWVQMQISRNLWCSILLRRGWWFPGFLNAVWVLVGWQC